MYKHSKMKCINCGQIGHSYKICREPKISYGILAIHIDGTEQLKTSIAKYLRDIDDITENQYIVCNDEKTLERFTTIKNTIKFLMIMRKHTLGYMEFVRGHYSVNNIRQLSYLFEQMTPAEIKTIADNSQNFDYLWKNMWTSEPLNAINSHPEPDNCQNVNKQLRSKQHDFKSEYDISKINFEKLRDETPIKLCDIIKNTKSNYNFPEWGVPKGRRSCNETDIECAKREFTEETGYTDEDYILFDNIKPMVENIIGSNGVRYRHVYYLALLTTQKLPSCENLRKAQLCEIGDIGLFDLEQSIQFIRQHHVDRKKIMYTVCTNIIKNILTNKF